MPIHRPRRSSGASALIAYSLTTKKSVSDAPRPKRIGYHHSTLSTKARPARLATASASARLMRRRTPSLRTSVGMKGETRMVASPDMATPQPLALAL